MDVLFINSTDAAELREQTNGTMLLATKLLQAGLTADILCFYQIPGFKEDYQVFLDNAVERILEKAPRCVSFYTLWPYFHIMLRLAQRIKARAPGTVTVFGGPQATFSARAVLERLEGVDYICTGEGEDLVVPFFRAVLENRSVEHVPGVYYREGTQVVQTPGVPPLTDLETLPYWDDRLLPAGFPASDPDLTKKSYYMPIDAGRGCPFRCSFCCTNQFLHRSFRLKSADRILADLRYHKEHYGIRSFRLSHDAFTTNRRLVEELCDRLMEEDLGINWKCCSRIDLIDEALVLKMQQAGMDTIELGLETGSPRMQQLVNKRLDLSRAREMVKFLLEHKIHVVLFFMYGFPEETEEDLLQTLDLFFQLMDMGVQMASMAFCRFYPGTKDTEKYQDRLVFDPSITKISRHVFGYRQELDMILENKEIFPFFYHLDTPVRNEFQYLYFLGHWYQRFPRFGRWLRKAWPGGDLQFARDFLGANRAVFAAGMEHAYEVVRQQPLQMADNLLSYRQIPGAKQLRSMLELDLDLMAMAKAQEGSLRQKSYDFSYVEYKLGVGAEQLSDTRTEVLLRKQGGKVQMKVLRQSQESE